MGRRSNHHPQHTTPPTLLPRAPNALTLRGVWAVGGGATHHSQPITRPASLSSTHNAATGWGVGAVGRGVTHHPQHSAPPTLPSRTHNSVSQQTVGCRGITIERTPPPPTSPYTSPEATQAEDTESLYTLSPINPHAIAMVRAELPGPTQEGEAPGVGGFVSRAAHHTHHQTHSDGGAQGNAGGLEPAPRSSAARVEPEIGSIGVVGAHTQYITSVTPTTTSGALGIDPAATVSHTPTHTISTAAVGW